MFLNRGADGFSMLSVHNGSKLFFVTFIERGRNGVRLYP